MHPYNQWHQMARLPQCHSLISCLEALRYYSGGKWLATAAIDVLVNKPPLDRWRKKCELRLFSGKLLLVPSSGIKKKKMAPTSEFANWYQWADRIFPRQQHSLKKCCILRLSQGLSWQYCAQNTSTTQSKSAVEEMNHSKCEEVLVILSPMYFACISLFTYTQRQYVI